MPNSAEYLSFLQSQEKVYSKFGASREAIVKEGFKPHTMNGKGGYLVVFRHPEYVTSKLSEISRNINTMFLGGLVYDESNAHTTILDYGITDNFIPDSKVLTELHSAVNILSSNIKPSIIYTSWLVNQDTLIARGVPNEHFFNTVFTINEALHFKGIAPRQAWGAHITANRFTQSAQGQTARTLLEHIDQLPCLGESKPFAIDTGYFQITPEEFKFTTDRRVVL